MVEFNISSLEEGVVIDPGHGGADPGAVGNGIIEKNIVLEISLYQYKRFNQLKVPVKLTRSTDKMIYPNERTKIINNSGMKYCISNHINAGGGDGCEVIHSIYNDGKLATAIAGELVKEGQNLRRVFSRAGSSGKDYYFLHRETDAVTNIVEYGFLDSKGDDIAQLKAKYLIYAEAVVRAFCQYAGFKYTAPNEPSTENAIKVGADAVLPDGVFKKSDQYSEKVKIIQQYVNYWLPSTKQIEVDGYYGENTARAIKEFQTARSIAADGIYGPNTKRELLEFYAEKIAKEKEAQKSPAAGVRYRVKTGTFTKLEHAKLLQERLQKEGYVAYIVQD